MNDQCETCDGSGRVTVTNRWTFDRGTVWQRSCEELVEDECPACDGTGEQKGPQFDKTSCSQCGREFGPGNHGYSHCKDHNKSRA